MRSARLTCSGVKTWPNKNLKLYAYDSEENNHYFDMKFNEISLYSKSEICNLKLKMIIFNARKKAEITFPTKYFS